MQTQPIHKLYLFILVTLFSCSVALGQGTETPELRLDAVDSVVTDLDAYIPRRMSEENVLGLSISFIRGEEIVWEKGYGIANSLTRNRVSPDTVFSVASNGKAVAAYLAMKQVERGGIELDKPITARLERRWLPESPQHDSVTVRHLLTHTSGLSNYLQDKRRRLSFAPGERFSYSGVGFMYLQELLAQNTGETLDGSAQKEVFEPLNMKHSYFAEAPNKPFGYARGHISLGFSLIPFSIIFLPVCALLLLAAFIITRVRSGSWRIGKTAIALCIFIPAAAAIGFLSYLSGQLTMPLYFAACFFVSALVWLAATFGFLKLVGQFNKRFKAKGWVVGVLLAVWVASTLVASTLILKDLHVPLPDWFPREGNAASSMRSTSGDLARFLIEFSRKRNLDPALVDQMITPHQKVNADVSWGLGLGIQHSASGDSIWHWGSNPGSKSIMVYYPKQKIGVVILTNSENGNEITRDIAGRALGGKAIWDASPEDE